MEKFALYEKCRLQRLRQKADQTKIRKQDFKVRMKAAMSVRGDLIDTTPRKPIVSKDKNVVIHCGKLYFKTGGNNFKQPALSDRERDTRELL